MGKLYLRIQIEAYIYLVYKSSYSYKKFILIIILIKLNIIFKKLLNKKIQLQSN